MQGKVAAMHAHVPELEARLAQLQAEVAPLVERHQILSDQLPWKQQLVRTLTYYSAQRQLSLPWMSSPIISSYLMIAVHHSPLITGWRQSCLSVSERGH